MSPRRSIARAAFGAGVLLALSACAAPPGSGSAPGSSGGSGHAASIVLPPTSGVFDYQLGGASDDVRLNGAVRRPDVVVRDATAEPLSGAYNVCYVNGFQTQPGAASAWAGREDAFLRGTDGKPVVDPEWPDEAVLDPGSEDRRRSILEVVGPLIDGCARDGYRAVEIDNLDTFERFETIDRDAALALADAYVKRAHTAGLAIGQKNAAGLARTAHDELGFDFAVTEQCHEFDECADYTDAYGTHVLQIEYSGSLGQICADPSRAPLAIIRDRELLASTQAGYSYSAC